jgi:hypothetical protein
MKFDLSTILATGAKIATALTGGEDITIRHSGLTTTVPYAGNENKTVLQILQEAGGNVGIQAGARPSVSRPGEGAVALDAPVQAGEYDVFTDKKENA